MTDIKPGQVYVAGTSPSTARRLLDAARRVGLDPKLAVRTTEGGFVVPEAVATNASKPAVKAQPAKKTPAKKADTDSSAAPPRRRRKKNPEKES